MPPLPPIPETLAAQEALGLETIQDLLERYGITLRLGKPPIKAQEIWYLQPALVIQQAADDIARAAGGIKSFKKIFRLPSVVLQELSGNIRGQVTWWGRIVFCPEIDPWTVAHELGHFLDSRHLWLISRDMEQYTHGRTGSSGPFWKSSWVYTPGDWPVPCCTDVNFNRKEDFAESLAAYVYPEQAATTALERSRAYNKPECAYAVYGLNSFRETRRAEFIYNTFQKYGS